MFYLLVHAENACIELTKMLPSHTSKDEVKGVFCVFNAQTIIINLAGVFCSTSCYIQL